MAIGEQPRAIGRVRTRSADGIASLLSKALGGAIEFSSDVNKFGHHRVIGHARLSPPLGLQMPYRSA
jgi:hypothetical protein